MRFKFMWATLVGIASLGLEASNTTVIAVINGKNYTIMDFQKDLGPKGGQINLSELGAENFKKARDAWIAKKLLENAVAKANLANDPEVQKIKAAQAKNIEQSVFLKRELEKLITDAKLQPTYENFKKKFQNQKEVELAVIIVDTQTEADKVLSELNAGKDFYEMAKLYSKEASTKQQGGRLGYLLEPAISQVFGPEFGNSLKVLKPNVHGKKPFKAKDGRFIIFRKGETRSATVPSFKDVREQLKGVYAQQALLDYLIELKNKNNVKVFTLEGKPDTMALGK